MKYKLMIAMFTLGLVDQVEDDIAAVELTKSNNTIVYQTMHVGIFPCIINEGDFFYFVYIDDVTEIRCGEPPE